MSIFFFWLRTEWFQKNITDHIKNKFAISKEETQAFRYLGLNIAQKKTEIVFIRKST